MSDLEKLYTTRDLAERYGCKPRAVAEKAWRKEWPSTKVLGEYRFTPAMVEWIDRQHEHWPNEQAATPQQPKPKVEPVRPARQRRTPQPPPAAAGAGNNVRRLVAKDRSQRLRGAS